MSDCDRGDKLRHYQQLLRVQNVLFVSHGEATLTLHRRTETGWVVTEALAVQTVTRTRLQGSIAVDDVYPGGLEDVR